MSCHLSNCATTKPNVVPRVIWKRPAQISWHRGGSELAAHASPDAFRGAIAHPAELIEIDVRSTADGELVVWHDYVTPNGQAVHLQTLKAIQEQAHVWRWEEFVSALADGDPHHIIGVHLDLKDTGYELDAVDPLIALGQPFFVTSLEQSSIALLRRERPQEDAFLTIGRARESRSLLSYAVLRFSELFPMRALRRTSATGVAIHVSLLRLHLRWWLARRNLRVVVWTVNSTVAINDMLRTSVVDAVTTNFPLKAIALRSTLADERK